MGISLTSCLGDSDPTVTGKSFGKIIESFPRIVVEAPDGVRFTALNTAADLSVFSGDYVFFQFSYDSEQQKVDVNTKNIDATITILEKMTYNPAIIATDKGESHENVTIVQIGDGANENMNGYNRIQFMYYDKSKVILPLVFLLKEASQASLNKHSFSLIYDESNVKQGDSELVFYLRHHSSETEAKKVVVSYKLFDINSALNHFTTVAGQKPANIVIYANETKEATTDDLEKKKDKLTKYSVEYVFKD